MPAAALTNVHGDKVAFRPLRRDLLPLYPRRRNDVALARTLNYLPGPYSAEEREAWFAWAARDANAIRFTLYERATGRPIGIANLHDIDDRQGTVEFGLMIGEADCRGKGYGTEASRLMLDYAFTLLGLHAVMLRVYADNEAGPRAYEKAGFREIGRRESRVLAGRRWDEVFIDCLASEFESPFIASPIAPDEPRFETSPRRSRRCRASQWSVLAHSSRPAAAIAAASARAKASLSVFQSVTGA